MQTTLKIALAGGGTGGHLYPAINVLKVFEKRYDCEALFFGTKRGIEARKIPESGYKLKLINIRGFQRRVSLENLLFPFRVVWSMAQSRKALRQFKPDLLIGSGGYVMGPVLKQAHHLGIPFVLQEQNSFPGVTTRWLAARAKAVFVAYSEVARFLPESTTVVDTGNPLNIPASFPGRQEALEQYGFDADKPTLLVFGGSQGARSLNEAMHIICKTGLPMNLQVIWQTGDLEYEKYKQSSADITRGQIKIVPFIDDMWQAYAAADFALCRAGAMSISELAVAGLPAILVPLKSSAGNHQFKNAESLQHSGAAVLIEDDEKLADSALNTIRGWLREPGKLKEMAVQLSRMARPDAADKIVDYIAEKILNIGNK